MNLLGQALQQWREEEPWWWCWVVECQTRRSMWPYANHMCTGERAQMSLKCNDKSITKQLEGRLPGAMVLTRIPMLDRSRAIGRVMPTIAPFDAAYAACPICPSYAATLAVLMITPRCPSSPSGSAFDMRSADKRITLNEPRVLTSMVLMVL